MSDESQGGLAQAARVEAYEEDWYRSLKALAERRRDLFGPDDEPEESDGSTVGTEPPEPGADAEVPEPAVEAEVPQPPIEAEVPQPAVATEMPDELGPAGEAPDEEPAATAGSDDVPSHDPGREIVGPFGQTQAVVPPEDGTWPPPTIPDVREPGPTLAQVGTTDRTEVEPGTPAAEDLSPEDPSPTEAPEARPSLAVATPISTLEEEGSSEDALPERREEPLPPGYPTGDGGSDADRAGDQPTPAADDTSGVAQEGASSTAGEDVHPQEQPDRVVEEPAAQAPRSEEPVPVGGSLPVGSSVEEQFEEPRVEEPRVEEQVQMGPSLLSRDPQERRRALIELSTREPSDPELEQICGLLMDPDREVRLLAVQTLAGFPERVEDDAVRRAIQDPDDEIRAAAVRLVAHRTGDVSLLAPLLSARRHPRTQRTVLEVLPPVIASTAPQDDDVAAVVHAVGEMDPGPQDDERERLSDAERLGAVRLLEGGSSPAVLRALAALVADPMEEIRTRAQRAAEELARSSRPSGAESHGSGKAPVEPVAMVGARLADLDPAERDRAADELARRDRKEVLAWVLDSVTAGTTQDAELGALAAARLGLHEAAPALLARTTDVSSQERRLLLKSLQAVHAEPAVLVASLDAIDPGRRPLAVDLLWELAGSELIPHVATLLTDASPAVRVAALEGLGETADPEGVQVAEMTLTGDPAPSVRAAAVRALGRCIQGSPGVAMERALADPDPDVRATALQSLPLAAEDRLADLVSRSLADPDDRVRRAAMHRFAEVAGGDRDAAWAALRGCPPREPADMVAALQQTDSGLTELAFERLRSPEEEERVLAVEVVGWGGSPGCVEAGIQALGDPSAPVRRAAVASLGRLRDPSAAGALNKALVDPDPDVRIGAVSALGVIDDESVLGSLVTALKDPESRVRRAASQVLTEWSSPAVARRLAGVLAVPSLRDSAADLLTRIGPASVELLIDVLRQGNPALSPIVGGLLSRIVGIEDLLNRFSSPDPERRLRAVEAVAAVGGSSAVDALIRTLFDPDERIRIRSAQLLGTLGDRRAEQPIRQAALEDPVPEVVEAANESLARLSAEDGGQAA